MTDSVLITDRLVRPESETRNHLRNGRFVNFFCAQYSVLNVFLAELHLLSPTLGRLSPSQKVESTLELVDRLFDSSSAAHKKLNDAALFGQFVVRSWAGLFRSAGL